MASIAATMSSRSISVAKAHRLALFTNVRHKLDMRPPLWALPLLPRPEGQLCCRSTSSDSSHSAPAALPKPQVQATQPKVPKTWNIRPITKDDVDFAFSRSSGAGGQNVNKVSTKVDMRLDLSKAAWIPDEIREQIRVAEKNRITNDGFLVVQSQKHRVQAQNLEDALAKLQAIIDAAREALTPTIADAATVKRVQNNIKAGQERRIQDKKKDAKKKQERSRKNWD